MSGLRQPREGECDLEGRVPRALLGGRVLLVLVLDVGLHADEDVGGEGARRREPRVEELACVGLGLGVLLLVRV